MTHRVSTVVRYKVQGYSNNARVNFSIKGFGIKSVPDQHDSSNNTIVLGPKIRAIQGPLYNKDQNDFQ